MTQMPEAKRFYQHHLTHRKPGESFTFHPVLDQTIEEYAEGILTDIKPFDYEDIGKGEVHLYRLNLAADFGEYDIPAGPVAPFRFQMVVFDLPKELLTTVTATIAYGDLVYNGLADYDTVPLKRDKKTNLDFFAFSKQTRRDRRRMPLFPPTTDFLKIDYTINNNGHRRIRR